MQVAIVTGASSGIGFGCATKLAEMGMAVVGTGRLDTVPLVTHRFALDDIEEAYALFAAQRDGVLKVALRP